MARSDLFSMIRLMLLGHFRRLLLVLVRCQDSLRLRRAPKAPNNFQVDQPLTLKPMETQSDQRMASVEVRTQAVAFEAAEAVVADQANEARLLKLEKSGIPDQQLHLPEHSTADSHDLVAPLDEVEVENCTKCVKTPYRPKNNSSILTHPNQAILPFHQDLSHISLPTLSLWFHKTLRNPFMPESNQKEDKHHQAHMKPRAMLSLELLATLIFGSVLLGQITTPVMSQRGMSTR